MKNRINTLLYIEPSAISGVIVLFITFIITFLLQNNGLSMLETCLLPFITGFILFFTTLITNIVFTYKIKRNKKIDFELYRNKYKQVLIILFCSIIIYIFLDSILFLIDDSLCKDYAISLDSFAEAGELKEDEGFENLPFSIQNLFVTVIFGLLGSLCSLPLINQNH